MDTTKLDYIDTNEVRNIIIDSSEPSYGRDVYGYGMKVPTHYRLRLTNGRTVRVYAVCVSNAGTMYVQQKNRPYRPLSIDLEIAVERAERRV